MHRCYECGDFGHLSYSCPKNLLGNREPPKKKSKKRRGDFQEDDKFKSAKYEEEDAEEDEDEEPKFEEDSLSEAIRYQVRYFQLLKVHLIAHIFLLLYRCLCCSVEYLGYICIIVFCFCFFSSLLFIMKVY